MLLPCANANSHDPNQVEAALDDTLQKLGVGYLDLYHMHWPVKNGWFGRKYIDYIVSSDLSSLEQDD